MFKQILREDLLRNACLRRGRCGSSYDGGRSLIFSEEQQQAAQVTGETCACQWCRSDIYKQRASGAYLLIAR